MIVDESYFIIEVETGFIDGFYTKLNSLEYLNNSVERWNKKRPEYKHVLCQYLKTENIDYNDFNYLNDMIAQGK
jgi:hypothetical protein